MFVKIALNKYCLEISQENAKNQTTHKLKPMRVFLTLESKDDLQYLLYVLQPSKKF